MNLYSDGIKVATSAAAEDNKGNGKLAVNLYKVAVLSLLKGCHGSYRNIKYCIVV